jgi:hypothetical protein
VEQSALCELALAGAVELASFSSQEHKAAGFLEFSSIAEPAAMPRGQAFGGFIDAVSFIVALTMKEIFVCCKLRMEQRDPVRPWPVPNGNGVPVCGSLERGKDAHNLIDEFKTNSEPAREFI